MLQAVWRCPEEDTTNMLGTTQLVDEVKDVGGRLIAQQIGQCGQYDIAARLDTGLWWIIVVVAAAGAASGAFI